MRKLLYLIFLSSIFTLSATVINIPADHEAIQSGINTAVDGDTVLVQPGTYYENINYQGKEITVTSLFLSTQDTTYISQTIIDGNQDGSVVTFENGEDSTAVLCGFKLTNGLSEYGGGVKIYESSPKLSYLIIINNNALLGGGISCNINSSPKIENTQILENTAESRGGGFWCRSSCDPYFDNVAIDSNNSISSKGGGIYISSYSAPVFNTIKVTNNHTGYIGGGVYCRDFCTLIFKNSIISDNVADHSGGGVSIWYNSMLEMTNSIVSGNQVEDNPTGRGGGCESYASSSAILTNVEISNNTSDSGGGLYLGSWGQSSYYLNNVTIADNSAQSGGGIYLTGASIDLTNSIVWNNMPEEVYFKEEDHASSITVSYSDLLGGEAGIVTNDNGTINWLEGNIDADPIFIGTGMYPYSLQVDSPCINTGTPDTTGLNLPEYDLAGNPRISEGRIDMGAYEREPIVDIPEDLPSIDFQFTNYPNPFNPSTIISFELNTESTENTEIEIFNIKGQSVVTLSNPTLSDSIEGRQTQTVIWNGTNQNNNPVASGVYFLNLKVGSEIMAVKKCLLLK